MSHTSRTRDQHYSDIENIRSPLSMTINVQEFAMPDAANQVSYVDLAAGIVSAFVTKNAVSPADLPALIASVHGALSNAGNGKTPKPQEELRPAVAIKKSLTPDY